MTSVHYGELAINGAVIIGRKKKDRESFLDKYAGYLGLDMPKEFVIRMDYLRPHVVLVCGKKGYGKSYSLGVIGEEFLMLDEEVRKNLALVIFDPMGIFWSLKLPNLDSSEKKNLENIWKMSPTKFNDVQVFIPKKYESEYRDKEVMYDETLLINPGELEDIDWCYTFEIDLNTPMGLTLSLVISDLKESYENSYLIEHIIQKIKTLKDTEASVQTQKALIRRFSSIQEWGIFIKDQEIPTSIHDIVRPGKISVINLSDIREDFQGGWGVRNLIAGLISRKIFEFRVKARKNELVSKVIEGNNTPQEIFPMVWMLIDEAHRFAPRTRNTAAKLALNNWARLGRQPGLSLVLATQRPGSLSADILSQCDVIFSHRLTAQVDVDALNRIRPVYSSQNLLDYISELPKDEVGYCIVIDDINEQIIPMQIRARRSWHSGEDAIAKK